MKFLIFALFSVVLFAANVSSHAQVVPAATKDTFSVSAGGLGSMFQPDYAGEGIAQTSPNRLYGIGAYGDVRFSRWVQIEGEARWLRFNEYLGINQNTYLVGPRIPILNFHGLVPYGKFLVGMGNGSFLTGNSFVFAYGGGADYKLSRRFTLRAFDFEYEQWQVTPTLHPYGGSVGLSYRIF
jgi:opacity protein-like surface antigen